MWAACRSGWLAYELERTRAGVTSRARIQLENAGFGPWRSRRKEGVQVSYHWLDPLATQSSGRARTPLPHVVEPGSSVALEVPLVAPRPPGDYRLAFDIVEGVRYWFEELGSTPLDVPVRWSHGSPTEPFACWYTATWTRDTKAGAGCPGGADGDRRGGGRAQLVPGAIHAPDWSRRLLARARGGL